MIVSFTGLTVNTNGSVPVATYDVGQLFSARVGQNSGGGGASYLGNLCAPDLEINGTPSVFKAGVGLGVPDPQGSGWIFLLAHEFTHAFGANHTWLKATAHPTSLERPHP